MYYIKKTKILKYFVIILEQYTHFNELICVIYSHCVEI